MSGTDRCPRTGPPECPRITSASVLAQLVHVPQLVTPKKTMGSTVPWILISGKQRRSAHDDWCWVVVVGDLALDHGLFLAVSISQV